MTDDNSDPTDDEQPVVLMPKEVWVEGVGMRSVQDVGLPGEPIRRHECPLPPGEITHGDLLPLAGVGEPWQCPDCHRIWRYVMPFGMYPGWRCIWRPVQ